MSVAKLLPEQAESDKCRTNRVTTLTSGQQATGNNYHNHDHRNPMQDCFNRTHGAEEFSDRGLQSVVDRAAAESTASYAFLLLSGEGSSELYTGGCLSWKETPKWCAKVAETVISSATPLLLKDPPDAEAATGCRLGKELLPLICAPVGSNSTYNGVLTVGCPRASYEKFSQSLPGIVHLADLAGALLEVRFLRRTLQRKDELVDDLVRDTFAVQEAERELICLEVHDGVTQTLASVFQYLQALETNVLQGTPGRPLLLKASALVKQAIQESREVVNSLQPATLRDLGLVATLRQEIRQLVQEMGWEVDFDACIERPPRHVETALYRIIHEAINNARKHASTKRLRISLTSVDGLIKVEVRDWGTGFNQRGRVVRSTDPPDTNPRHLPRRQGIGLFSMRKRAELLRGIFDIESAPGSGTVVRLEVPFGDEGMHG